MGPPGHFRVCALYIVYIACSERLGGKKIALRGGGGTRKPIFPTPPPSLLGRRDGGRGGFRAGAPDLPCRGGGVNPTSMAQNDTHVALIILTTQMWGGRGGLLVEKTFSGQILCSCAFGANIRFYTKQRARHGTPFLQPPPPPSAGVHVTPPPPPPRRAIFRSPWGTAASMGEGAIVVPLLAGAASAPGRPSHAGVGTRVSPKTIKFGGCSPPHLMWEREHGARGAGSGAWVGGTASRGTTHGRGSRGRKGRAWQGTLNEASDSQPSSAMLLSDNVKRRVRRLWESCGLRGGMAGR